MRTLLSATLKVRLRRSSVVAAARRRDDGDKTEQHGVEGEGAAGTDAELEQQRGVLVAEQDRRAALLLSEKERQ